jgi:hypothetical protein
MAPSSLHLTDGVPSIAAVQPVHVSTWIEASTRELDAPSVKPRLAALRHLFDWLVNSQVVPVNPAHTVRGPRQVVRRGKTPVLVGCGHPLSRGRIVLRSNDPTERASSHGTPRWREADSNPRSPARRIYQTIAADREHRGSRASGKMENMPIWHSSSAILTGRGLSRWRGREFGL